MALAVCWDNGTWCKAVKEGTLCGESSLGLFIEAAAAGI